MLGVVKGGLCGAGVSESGFGAVSVDWPRLYLCVIGFVEEELWNLTGRGREWGLLFNWSK